ncbi:hypothetical protein BX666DRAFT_1879791 [Dichotomocladium elegans]|nr:hypothetical protein BX666DRAFT_1879791 [Dichotomocladium elegans]
MLLSRHQTQQPPLANDTPPPGSRNYGSLLTDHASSRLPVRAQYASWMAIAQNGSLETILQLVSVEHTSHDPNRTACQRCDAVTELYMAVLDRLSAQAMSEGQIRCSRELLVLVLYMSQMVIDHASFCRPEEDEEKGHCEWFDGLAKGLWHLAKHLKDETRAPDCHVITTLSNDGGQPTIIISEPDHSLVVDNEDDIRRAIRIVVYNCRAHVYRQNAKVDKAIVYLRKCLAVCPPRVLDIPQQLQLQYLRESAQEALQILLLQTQSTPSRCGSISSSDSKGSTSTTCGHCGMEKRAMPVCAKCRSRSYCSRRCLVADKQAHDRECRPRLSASSKQG